MSEVPRYSGMLLNPLTRIGAMNPIGVSFIGSIDEKCLLVGSVQFKKNKIVLDIAANFPSS